MSSLKRPIDGRQTRCLAILYVWRCICAALNRSRPAGASAGRVPRARCAIRSPPRPASTGPGRLSEEGPCHAPSVHLGVTPDRGVRRLRRLSVVPHRCWAGQPWRPRIDRLVAGRGRPGRCLAGAWPALIRHGRDVHGRRTGDRFGHPAAPRPDRLALQAGLLQRRARDLGEHRGTIGDSDLRPLDGGRGR
jgi:hypothetical protein